MNRKPPPTLPATQPSPLDPLDPLDWLKEIVELGPTKDWKQNMSATYRAFAAQGPGGIPMGLLKVVSTAPSDFGSLIRDTAIREWLNEKEDATAPSSWDSAWPLASRSTFTASSLLLKKGRCSTRYPC